ncbi:MAG: hypothetical protein ACRD3W_23880 [Terriglobales bacterium]
MRAHTFSLICAVLFTSVAAAAERMTPSDIQTTFFNAQPFTAATLAGTQYKMTFTPDGKMIREPTARAGYKNNGTWKLDAKGFCTSWKKAKATCYTVVPNGNNKWSVIEDNNVIATWTK